MSVRKKAAAKNDGKAQRRQARSMDELAAFEKFGEVFSPKLQKAILDGWSVERIRKEFAPVLQALMVKKGLDGNFNAIKDVLDRHEGTAVQRVEQKTVYAKMTQKEKAALALQKMKDAKLLDNDGRPLIIEAEVVEADDN